MGPRAVIPGLVLILYLDAAAAALPFRTVVLSGQPAPGTPQDIILSGFHSAVVNENGTVAFNAFVSGPGVTHSHPSNAIGIWRERAGALTNVVRAGEQAVNLPTGVNYYLPGPPRIDGAGRAAFPAAAPGESTQGIFSEGQGVLRLVGREADQIPGQPAGVTFDILSLVPLMNEPGNIAFTSFIRGPGLPSFAEALFTDRSGPLELVIRHGSPAPGIPGATIRQIDPPVLNDLGVIAFSGRHTDGVFPNDYALWTEQFGTFNLLARSGQAAQGMPAGVVYGQLSGPRVNNAGQLMFRSTLSGPGITDANESALWLYDGGDSRMIAREGSAAAGLAAGINHGNFLRGYLNGAGESTFTGLLVGSGVDSQNDTALWSQRGDVLTLIAREGDPAPGSPAGVTFGDFSQLGGSLGFQVNNVGQVAFEATLTGSGITPANDIGIWVTDLAGTLRLVARKGDLFDVNDDPGIEELRTIAFTDLQWYSGGGEDGYGSSFNNRGELAIALNFTDLSSGVFVINAAVPEPSIAILLATAMPFARARYRREVRD